MCGVCVGCVCLCVLVLSMCVCGLCIRCVCVSVWVLGRSVYLFSGSRSVCLSVCVSL